MTDEQARCTATTDRHQRCKGTVPVGGSQLCKRHAPKPARCDGSGLCPAVLHEHGCYTDRDGSACTDPTDHEPPYRPAPVLTDLSEPNGDHCPGCGWSSGGHDPACPRLRPD